MTTNELLLTLCGAIGVSGAENGARDAARSLLEPLGPCETAVLGSLICRVKPVPESGAHMLLTAHMDSIGMIVTFIDDNGFLRVAGCGGVDRATLPAAQVTVHTASGALPGVVCTVPPHLTDDDGVLPKVDEISIDVGLAAEAARSQIAPGDRVTFDCEPFVTPAGLICSRALDDRAGCAAVILAAQKLARQPLACGLSVALTVMEEVGGQGARTAANLLAPTHAVAVDVSFGHTPDAPRPKCGVMGDGPMIGVSPILDHAMFEGMKACAKRHDIDFQVEVMGGNTGTDADGVAVGGAGVRSALVSIPLRYMHTPAELIDARDVEQTAALIAAYVTDEFGGAR